jgi:hypothetical protein
MLSPLENEFTGEIFAFFSVFPGANARLPAKGAKWHGKRKQILNEKIRL